MIGELSYFLGLQVKQSSAGIFDFSRKIFERDIEEISDGRFFYSQHTYGGWLQAEQR
jgi:hypothetical protein